MSDRKSRPIIADIRGGLNAYDPEWAIADRECVDAVNVDWYKGRLGNKRGGLLSPTTTNVTRTGTTSSLFRHVPTTDETLAELWAVDDAGTPIIERLTGGTAWSAPTLKDAPTGNGWDVSFASINGKLFLAYKSAQDRLHCWDPVSASVRRTGLAATGAPTCANTGGGAYAAVLRYYRERSTVQVGGVTIRRAEASASVSFTPSGAGTAARVTQATVINEGETHWEVEASTDNVTFYRIATVVIGTTTYDDSAVTTTYSANPLSALTGVYTLQKSYKFIAADQNRLLGYGAWTSTNKQARTEISGVIGSLDISDEERVDTSAVNSYLDFDEKDSGVATGLKGPIFGGYFAFKDRQIYKLTPTGDTSAPYQATAISKSIGAITHVAMDAGDDAVGNPALYFMSHRGPYRWTVRGLEYLGKNLEPYVLGPTATINLAATKRTAVVLYYPDKRQVWFWWAVAASNDPSVGFLFDTQTEGWSRVPTGDRWANVRCATLFSNTLGASMSRDLKPYVGQTGAAVRLWKADVGTDDNGTAFQAYVITKAMEPGGPGFRGEVGDAVLLAKVSTGVTITATVTADFGIQTEAGTALLTASASETRVSKVLEGTALAGVSFVQYQLGDASAVANSWTLDRLLPPIGTQEAVSG